jgi:hypothetical protein
MVSKDISNRYSVVLDQYRTGRLQEEGYWDVHQDEGASGNDDVRASDEDLFEDTDQDSEG